MRVSAPPRYSGVLNKSLGFDRPPSTAPQREQGRSHGARQAGPRGEHSLADVPEGRTRHTRILKSWAPHTYGSMRPMAREGWNGTQSMGVVWACA